MAGKEFLRILLFFFFTSSRTFSSYSEPDSQYTTAVFDVPASIQSTLDALSSNPNSLKPTEQQEEESSSTPLSSSSYTLPIYSRSSLHKSQNKDYSALMLSRLERDSARVKSIAAKLEHELNDGAVNISELMPVRTAAYQTPVTSGYSQGSGEYFSSVGIGQPAKQYYLTIDTGSDVSWLQCQPCSYCYQQSGPIFDPSRSSTYRSLTCKSAQCNALQIYGCQSPDSCLYGVSYGDGSFTVGNLATETVTFGNSGSVNNVAIGCGHDNEGLFVGAAGLLGLGGGPLSLTSQLKARSFSYCLVDRSSSGSSTLEFNTARPGDSVTAPLLRNSRMRTFFYVALTGLSVGGRPLPISPSVFKLDASGRGGVIVDSGTTVTRLKTEVYNSLRDAFVSGTRNLPRAMGFAIFDTCYDLSRVKTVSLPTVSFLFPGGKTLTLRPGNFLFPVDSSGKFCLAFAPTNGPLSIIGNTQQQGTRVSYDLANSLVGFSPNKC